jgi:hypothetical protein
VGGPGHAQVQAVLADRRVVEPHLLACIGTSKSENAGKKDATCQTETLIKRQATRHNCLPSLLSDGEDLEKKWPVRNFFLMDRLEQPRWTKISCIGLTGTKYQWKDLESPFQNPVRPNSPFLSDAKATRVFYLAADNSIRPPFYQKKIIKTVLFRRGLISKKATVSKAEEGFSYREKYFCIS